MVMEVQISDDNVIELPLLPMAGILIASTAATIFFPILSVIVGPTYIALLVATGMDRVKLKQKEPPEEE